MGLARATAKAGLTVEKVIEAIRRQVDGTVKQLFDGQGNLIPIQALTDEDADLIADFSVIIKNAAAGDGHTDTIHRVKKEGKAKFVELAAKYLGMLEERVAITNLDKVLALLDEGRARNAAAARASGDEDKG